MRNPAAKDNVARFCEVFYAVRWRGRLILLVPVTALI